MSSGITADHEYAMYVKGMILRLRGEILESLKLFQKAMQGNPRNVDLLKQVARSLFLLGRFKGALEVYTEAIRLTSEDWEMYHSMGLCHMSLKDYDEAIRCFRVRKRGTGCNS
jgi:Bardet-Biedl syndrome 4 protein